MFLRTLRRGAGLALALMALNAAPLAARADDIVDTARKAGRFRTLLAAAKAAGLVDALKSDGPFTLFAPTDEAFAKIPRETLDGLLRPENRDKLAAILTYHVIPSKAMAADVVKLDGKGVKSVEGSDLMVMVEGKNVMVGKAKVVKTDIAASNGVIHVIDTVLMPPTK